jgi:hypothetical protein
MWCLLHSCGRFAMLSPVTAYVVPLRYTLASQEV